MKKSIDLIKNLIEKIEKLKSFDVKNSSNYEKILLDLQNILNMIVKNRTYMPTDKTLYFLLINEFEFMMNDNEKNINKYFEETSILDLMLILSSLNKEYGNLMESLFFSNDYIVGIHATTNHNDEILNNILKNGLINNYRADLTTTVHLFDKDKSAESFQGFLLYNHKLMSDENCVIVAIPKNNTGAIWCKVEDKYYLNPYYIVGIIKDMHKGAIINKNPEIIYNYNSAFISKSDIIPNDQIYNYPDEYLQKLSISDSILKK